MSPAPATGYDMLMIVRLLLLLLCLVLSACALPLPVRLRLSLSAGAWLTLPYILPLLLLLAVRALSRRFQPIWPAFLSLLPSLPASRHVLLLQMPVKVRAWHGRRCYSRLGRLTQAD